MDTALDSGTGSYTQNFGLTPQSEEFLRETGRWAKFIAIVVFIMSGLLVVAGIFFSSIMGALSNMGGNTGIPAGFGAMFSVIYFALAALYIMPALYLFNFSTGIKRALQTRDSATLESSLSNLKSHYKFIGIFVAVVLGFYALVLLGTVIVGVFASR